MNQNQKRCLDFIKGYIASNGYSPSYQEMADYLGFASKSAIFTIIKNLKDEGYIKVTKRGQRNIKLAECENCEILQKQLDIAVEVLKDTYAICFRNKDTLLHTPEHNIIGGIERDCAIALKQIKELKK